MCGICGIVLRRGSPERERLEAMAATRAPRPRFRRLPRRRSRRSRGAAALDHRSRARRPADRERGRLAARRPERRDLQLPRARRRAPPSRSRVRDSLRHGSARARVRGVGDAFTKRLRGMFAIAIWDAPRQRLLLARDPFGIKPPTTVYRAKGSKFASELRPAARGDRSGRGRLLSSRSTPSPRR